MEGTSNLAHIIGGDYRTVADCGTEEEQYPGRPAIVEPPFSSIPNFQRDSSSPMQTKRSLEIRLAHPESTTQHSTAGDGLAEKSRVHQPVRTGRSNGLVVSQTSLQTPAYTDLVTCSIDLKHRTQR